MNQEDYFELLRFQSISADPSKKKDLQACADWVENKLKELGATVEQWTIEGRPPTVFGVLSAEDPEAPTLMLYNHYDVQPVDPLELWESPPFEPTIRGERVYARGAEDNKGQLYYTLVAMELFLKDKKRPPYHIKWVIEGEEESGSTALHHFVKNHANQLKADGILVVDGGMRSLEHPSVVVGIRGIITMDLKVTGPEGDLHSGTEGGIALNPLHHLVEILAEARGKDGKVLIPHFYDQVKILSQEEKALYAFTLDQDEYIKLHGVTPEGGEKEFSPLERGTIRPTLEVNGITGGYGGEGFKTVLPSIASAKISCRLVPDQDPKEIGDLVKSYFESKSKPGAKVEVHLHSGGGPAIRCSSNNPLLETAKGAMEKAFGKPCSLAFEGGSIPITAALAKAADCEPLIVGLGLPSDAIHAPNENFSLEQIRLGTSFLRHFFETFNKERKR